MPIDYEERKRRWAEIASSFPPALRDHIALRNVEAVAALPDEARETLVAAIEAGLKRIPAAIEILRSKPGISAEELLGEQMQGAPHKHERTSVKTAFLAEQVEPASIENLTTLIQSCYPDMPRVAAEALAGSDALRVIVLALQCHEDIFRTASSDFAVVLFKAILEQSLSRLSVIIQSNPAYAEAVRRID